MTTTELVALQTKYASLKSALKQSEALLDAIFEQGIFALGYCDLQGKIVRSNRKFCELVGVESSQLLNSAFSEITHPENPQTASALLEQLVRGELGNYSRELGFYHPDGTVTWGQLTLSLVRDEAGEPLCFLLAIADLTQRKELEQKLHQQETVTSEQLKISQFAIEHAADAILWVKADAHFCYANLAACRLLGYQREELLAMKLFQIEPNFSPAVWEQEWQNLKHIGFVQFDTRVQAKDGSFISVQISVNYMEFNGTEYNCAFIRDISDRKRVEAELTSAQNFLSSVLENFPVSVLAKEAKELRFVLWNQATADIIGYSSEEVLGKNDYDFFPQEQADFFIAKDREALNAGKVIDIPEELIQHKSGERRFLHTKKTAITDSEGNPQYLLAIAEDITDRKLALEALAENEERWRQIFTEAPIGMALANTDNHQLVKVNHALCEMLGYTETELLTMTPTDITHPEDLDLEMSLIQQINLGEIASYHIEKRLVTKNSQIIWVNLKGTILRHPNGTIRYGLAMIENISQRKDLERELALRQARFDAFFTTSPAALVMYDEQLRYVQINEAAAEMNGLSIKEHLGKNVGELVPDLATTLEPMFQQILTTGKPMLNIEISGETPKEPDIFRHWIASFFPLLGEDSRPVGLGTVAVEISALKRAETALQESLERFELVVKATNDGIWSVRYIWEDGLTPREEVYYSPRLIELVGFTKSELKSISASYINRVHPEDRDRILLALAAHINERVPYQDVEYRLRTSNGEYRWVIARGQALWDSAGRVTRFAGSVRDITDRKFAEAALREKVTREELLNQLVTQIRTSLDLDKILATVVSSLQNLLNVDWCLFSWYRPQACPPVWEVVHEAKKSHVASFKGFYPTDKLASLTQRLINGEIMRVDKAATCPDLELRQVCMSFGYTSAIVLPIMTNSGEIGVFGCYHSTGARPWTDAEVELLQAVSNQLGVGISQAKLYNQAKQAALEAQEKATLLEQALSELKSAQIKLIQSEKMSSLGQMVAGIAHEINNPVSFIYGNIDHASGYISDLLSLVELYDQHYPNQAAAITELEDAIDLDFLKVDLPKVLGSMKIGATRIQEIVRSLRTFSRLDEAEKKAIDIHEGLDSTLRLLEHRLSEKSGHPAIKVIKSYGDLPLVECYGGQLNQVFMNLFTNAIDAIEECYQGRSNESIRANPGQIKITTQVEESSRVTINIADNGAGIPESVQQRLFDPFFTTKPVGKGTGLGLSISYQIVVERHSGQLRCFSTPGKGTEFAIEIPL